MSRNIVNEWTYNYLCILIIQLYFILQLIKIIFKYFFNNKHVKYDRNFKYIDCLHWRSDLILSIKNQFVWLILPGIPYMYDSTKNMLNIALLKNYVYIF